MSDDIKTKDAEEFIIKTPTGDEIEAVVAESAEEEPIVTGNADLTEYQIALSGPDAAFTVVICGYARLQELERRRSVFGAGGGRALPLPVDEELEYAALRTQWWNHLGPDKQDNLAAFVRAAAKEVFKVGGNF